MEFTIKSLVIIFLLLIILLIIIGVVVSMADNTQNLFGNFMNWFSQTLGGFGSGPTP